MSALAISAPDPVKVLGIGGSTRGGSLNGAALRAALVRAESCGARTTLIDLRMMQLPLLDHDRPLASYPEDVARLLEAVDAADAFVLCSPTYHGCMSGAFKNAIDLLVYGDDDYFGRKPVGLMALGGANGAPVLEMMTTMTYALNGLVVPTRVLVPHGVVNGDGSIADREVVARIERMVAEVIDIARALRRPETNAAPTPSATALLQR